MSKIEKIMDDMIKHSSTAGKIKSTTANIKDQVTEKFKLFLKHKNYHLASKLYFDRAYDHQDEFHSVLSNVCKEAELEVLNILRDLSGNHINQI